MYTSKHCDLKGMGTMWKAGAHWAAEYYGRGDVEIGGLGYEDDGEDLMKGW